MLFFAQEQQRDCEHSTNPVWVGQQGLGCSTNSLATWPKSIIITS